MAERHACGLSLIDVLCVAAVCLLVAAIIVPVFAQVQVPGGKPAPPALQITCASNIKAELNAFAAYSADWDNMTVLTFYPGTDVDSVAPGCMRPGSHPGDPPVQCQTQDPGWAYLLEPYRHGYELLKCDVGGDDFGVWDPASLYYFWYNWCRFAQHGYNWTYLCPSPAPGASHHFSGRQRPYRLSRFARPSDTIVFVDSRLNVSASWKRGYSVTDPPTAA